MTGIGITKRWSHYTKRGGYALKFSRTPAGRDAAVVEVVVHALDAAIPEAVGSTRHVAWRNAVNCGKVQTVWEKKVSARYE